MTDFKKDRGKIMSGTTIYSGTVASGQTITGGTLEFDSTLDVLSGGEIININAGMADVISIESGGVAVGTTLDAVGFSDSTLIVYAGATASQSAFFGLGDNEDVDGGVASGSTFQSGLGGASQVIQNGGIAYNTDFIGSLGTDLSFQDVDSGSTADGTTIGSNAAQTVNAGGTALETTIQSSGFETVAGGGEAVDTTVQAGGTMDLSGVGQGTQIIGGTEYISSESTSGDTDFVGSGGTLDLAGGGNFSGTTIFGFETLGNQIDLIGLTYSTSGSESLGFGNVLTVTEGTGIAIIQLDHSQNFSGDTFNLAPLAGGGVEIFIPCFAAGTRILTPRGEVPVEALQIGEAVITDFGDDAAIKWIGVRRLDLSRHPRPEKAQPILFEAHCFADGVPSRDLILSPDHALYVEGHLVPAKSLVNDRNIRQLKRTTVTYYHIELAEHSIIFAENTAVESYLETGNRGAFQNAPGALTLHPDLAQTVREQSGCAPFTGTGPVVEAARMRTLQQFYTPASTDRRRRRGTRSEF